MSENEAVVDAPQEETQSAADVAVDSTTATGTATADENEVLSRAGDDEEEETLLLDDERTNRKGTVSSACFNLLSTMVGGGSLSLPLAFQQAGNGLLAPVILIVVALITDFCFRILVASAPVALHSQRGSASFESVAQAAFGSKAHVVSTLLVCFMCFFGTVGYAVLLRDMLEPLSDAIWPSATRMTRNFGMLSIVLLVTPLCALETLTSLERFGATSMVSVLVLGTCVMIRSFQCVAESGWEVSLWPESPSMVLDAAPLFISCFVCHYNIHPVHNDLQRPSKKRVSQWLRWTTWSAATYYMAIGFSGSLYAACTPDGHITGNVLLSFDPNDPLLLVGRLCLALTITLAFPMLTIPARDIILRSWKERRSASAGQDMLVVDSIDLEEPLLDAVDDGDAASGGASQQPQTIPPSIMKRLIVAMMVFWSGAGVACCASSIDVVWDLLGSSLSILLSHLIPFGSYLVLVKGDGTNFFSRLLCWILLGVFVPLMFISTGNAIMNTFFLAYLPVEY
jgi:amino acid permease